MAITKNHAIDTTLKTAIDYILNPDKTDGKLLVSSFSYSPETADLEFERTRKYAIDKGKHLARHIIQSFEPGETTPEQARQLRRLQTHSHKQKMVLQYPPYQRPNLPRIWIVGYRAECQAREKLHGIHRR